MPMKRSGRAVTDARRVIEMDDVFELMIASALTKGRNAMKQDATPTLAPNQEAALAALLGGKSPSE